MRSIDIRIKVKSDGEWVLPPLPDVEPGEYQAVLVLEAEKPSPVRQPLVLPALDLGPWPENLSLRREDMYGDDGR
jgi:hypothetical protein